MPPRAASDSRPIGVFDSGVGGLTVLHECLVTMPHEDFVYLGDHARLPYGPRPLPELRRFAGEIGAFLEARGVKLIVAACNAATSAALPDLQARLSVPVVGVITPEAHAAVQTTRNRRIGLFHGKIQSVGHETSLSCSDFAPETLMELRGRKITACRRICHGRSDWKALPSFYRIAAGYLD